MRRKQQKGESTSSERRRGQFYAAEKRPWPWNGSFMWSCRVTNRKKRQSGACARRSIAGRRIVKKVTVNSTLMLCHVMYSMYGHSRSWAGTVHQIFRVCSNPVWTELPLSSTKYTEEFTSKQHFVIRLKRPSEGCSHGKPGT